MELREHNIKILNSLRETILNCNLSNPLLVSSNTEYLKRLKSQKRIMYIGQETNGWELSPKIDKLEECYLNFLKNGASNRDFWRFIKLIRDKENENLTDIVWSNALICGRYEEKGTPIITELLEEKSLENLEFLYNFFKPNMIVMVTGPNNPYYEIIQEFLKYINSSLVNLYPTPAEMLLIDETKNIHYTYHPNYLNRKGKLLELSKTINSYYIK